ncbi:MAG: efflux RND transporter permease subunit [Clostridia bacterium]|nr:efflux RND transporter permease subunit [Clostridia bacterium]MBP3561205.1 efflux RND transporter permease subunit [Treponema sp.]
MIKFYSNCKLSFFILLSISIVLGYSAFQIEIGESSDSKYNAFSVTFEYYGMDSKQIEELITIPLEEKLMVLEGLLELRSTIEYGKTISTAFFSKKTNYKKTYLNIRDVVEKLYVNLPSDVQRPKIQSSALNDKAFLCVSFKGNSVDGDMRTWIENNLKKEIESIDGVADVIISGGKINEIEIAFDADKVVALGQNPSVLSTIVQDANSINPGTKISYKNFNESIVFDTKLHTLDEVRKLPIKTNESFTTIDSFAEVSKKPRLDNEIVRINGEKCISIGIQSTSSGNIIDISKKCRSIIENKQNLNGTYQYLYDNGKSLENLIKRTFFAAIISFACIILIIPFFFNSLKILFLSVSFLLINTIWVIGILQILGLSLNQNTLSGITIALGLIADSMFVLTETAFTEKDFNSYAKHVFSIIPSMVSASLTTLLVLIPLIFLDEIIPGIKNISITIGLMIIISVILSVLFFPSFIYETSQTRINVIPIKIFNRISKFMKKRAIKYSLLSTRHSKPIKIIYLLLIFIPIGIFIFIGKDITFAEDNEVLFCSVEYEPEINADYINSSLDNLINKIQENNSVTFVRTEAKKGSAQVEVGFNSKICNKIELANYINSLSRYIADGFLYVPGQNKKNTKTHLFEIAIVGDDNTSCRNYAKQAVEILNKTDLCDSIVLNFKQPETIYEFIPSKELMNRNSLTTQQIASSLRWMLFGPVADKWLEDGKEFDIRIRGKNLQLANISELENLYLPIHNSSIRVTTLGELKKAEGEGKIYRKDQKRCAFFTVESSKGSIDNIIKELRFHLSELDLNKGYGISFSQEIENLPKQYEIVFITLFLSFLGIIILLTILTENIKDSIIIASIIPISFSLPLFIRLITGVPLQLGDITGMVILSGIGVNNTIYMIIANKFQIIFKFRSKFDSIMVTSLTSIISAIPLLLMKGEYFSKNLSFFMFWGIFGTLVACLLLYPGFLKSFDKGDK